MTIRLIRVLVQMPVLAALVFALWFAWDDILLRSERPHWHAYVAMIVVVLTNLYQTIAASSLRYWEDWRKREKP